MLWSKLDCPFDTVPVCEYELPRKRVERGKIVTLCCHHIVNRLWWMPRDNTPQVLLVFQELVPQTRLAGTIAILLHAVVAEVDAVCDLDVLAAQVLLVDALFDQVRCRRSRLGGHIAQDRRPGTTQPQVRARAGPLTWNFGTTGERESRTFDLAPRLWSSSECEGVALASARGCA